MPFLAIAEEYLKELAAGSVERVVLEFFRAEAVGRSNAKPWGKIAEHLAKQGLVWSKNKFQNGLLKESREGELFIGSCDDGYFLIETEEDAEAMHDWYCERMAQECERLRQLERLMKKAWPNCQKEFQL